MLLFDDVDTFGLRLWRKFVTHAMGIWKWPDFCASCQSHHLPLTLPTDRTRHLQSTLDPTEILTPPLKKLIGLNIAY
jgi:hypothetical protein